MVTSTIGLLRVLNLRASAPAQIRDVLRDLLDQGADSLIVDLRGVAGGSLPDTVLVLSEFLDSGTVLRTDERDWHSTGAGLLTDRLAVSFS